MALTISRLKTFIGASDFAVSRDFYLAIGWSLNWEDSDLAEFQHGESRFFLQRYYQKDWCNNSMLHATVDDAAEWYERIRGVLDSREYGAARVKPPEEQSYGAIVTFLWDPSGVLWHLAEPLPPAGEGAAEGP